MKRKRRTPRRARRTGRDPAGRLGKYKDEAQRLWHSVRYGDMGKMGAAEIREKKHVLVGILQETGHAKLAHALQSHRGLIRGTLLGEKIDRAIHGAPQYEAGGRIYSAGRPKKAEKTVWIAQLRSGEWLWVDHPIGNPSDGKPYFIGPGTGFDVHRLVVFASNEGDAIEIAEEKFPHLMFDEVDREDVDEDDQDIFPIESFKRGKDVWFKSGWARHSQDIRIFERARALVRARALGYGEAMLKDGKIVRYK